MTCNNIFKSLNTVKSRSFFFKLCLRKDKKEKVLRIIPFSLRILSFDSFKIQNFCVRINVNS